MGVGSAFQPPPRLPQQQHPQRPPPSRPNPHHHRWRLCSTATTTNDDLDEDNDPESFSSLFRGELPLWLLARTEALGFQRPTTVQRAALGPILRVRELLVWW